MIVRGWVYIIVNDAMPGLLKVGYSTKDPTLRAKELAGTGSPYPYRVAFDALVENPRDVEQSAHAILSLYVAGKEWFRCSHADAVSAIRTSASSVLLERMSAPESATKAKTVEVAVDKPQCCSVYSCIGFATEAYKGVRYCEKHYKEKRKARFDAVRKAINSSCE